MRASILLACVLFGAFVLNSEVSCMFISEQDSSSSQEDSSEATMSDELVDIDSLFDEQTELHGDDPSPPAASDDMPLPASDDAPFWDNIGDDDMPNNDAPKSFDQIFREIRESNNGSFDFVQDDGTLLMELDIRYKRETYDDLINNGGIEATFGLSQFDTGNRRSRFKRKAIRNKKWTNNVVPYQMSNIFSYSDRSVITAAINDYHRYTCIRFRAATSRDRNKISIQSGSGCSSYVGMIGGTQPVSLASGCRIKGIVIHELGHAIGFNHEQTRPDRDNYVTIYNQNIVSGMEFNFNKYTTQAIDSMGVPYDYSSVMHYGGTAFSKNGRYTIVAKDRNYQSRMGNRAGFSFSDIKLANLRYNCNSRCAAKRCPGEGFVGPDCKCWCPGTTTDPIRQCSGTGEVVTTTPTRRTTPAPTNGCNTDRAASCATYKTRGYCCKNHQHYGYMSRNCKKTCNICNGGAGSCTTTTNCADKGQHCAYWSGQGYCRSSSSYADFMRTNCAKTCNHCRSTTTTTTTSNCQDKSTNCSNWTRSGYCTSSYYRSWMSQNCKRSCRLCQ
ncbi:zinc metalloproteinase nas-13-like [Lineus longissimus]|uniref:zinc metalloproteinase nas-13-like n=1 Tax=Lineus longissimus TaxID=88925 RepID=UPI002B4E3439